MLHQCAILCNNLLQNIFVWTKLHHSNQSVEVAQHRKAHEDPNNPNCIAAGISGSVTVNHLWPVVAGGGGMKDEIEVHNAAVEAMFKKLKPIIEGDSSSVVLHALLVVLAMCGQQTALEPDVFKALVVQELDRLMLVNAERKGMLS
jgi:hypothetical protein